ncbi:MAG: indole-3-glycerol phosphate synthase [Gammaproteobacteria bacterium RIFCSPHIGHO2_12_FULL_41_15]|nr:MAG: indole-3-glycerol phosphate synthase [Gammaproteobacteria bacterium RIFCSPHIGHO2_12_FULL_41_15]
MNNYLTKILEHTRQSIEQLQFYSDPEASQRYREIKSLKNALSHPHIDIIAEVKRSSPSQGDFADIDDPIALVQQYAEGGASAISVLTNEVGFKGTIRDLQQVSQALRDSPIAVLRKDFIIDPLQILESFHYGADALLLIVSISKKNTELLLKVCHQYGLQALVEVHNREELDYALSIGADIIGINNRDLNTFSVDVNLGLTLKPHIPEHVITVAESGISDHVIAKRYIDAGFDALLIGETLVKSDHPQQMIKSIKQHEYLR